MTTTFYGKNILIDCDQNFINKILTETELVQKFPLTVCRKVSEAFALANKKSLNIRMIYVSEEVLNGENLEVVKKFMEENKSIPVILVKSENSNMHLKREEDLAIFERVMFYPKSYKEFVEYCLSYIEAKNNWLENAATPEVKFEAFDTLEDTFIPIALKDFTLTPNSFFNIHIRLGQTKFVKILNAGDEITSEMIEKYLGKGVTHLYVPSAEHSKYLAFTAKISRDIIKNPSAASDIKLRSTLKLGKNVIQNLSALGVNPEKLDHADNFLEQSVNLIRSIRMRDKTLKSFLEMLDSDEHSSTVAFMAGLIANELGFESTKSIKQVGLGALLHDIGLHDLRPGMEEVELNKMTDEEFDAFQKHATHGATLLRKSNCVDEAVCEIVEHHHKRRKGDSHNKRSTNINIATEIVSVADEFFNSVIRKDSNPSNLAHFQNISVKNFSPTIEKAFQRLLKFK